MAAGPPKKPFSGILDVLWDEVRRSEVAVSVWEGDQREVPKSLVKKIKALRAMERILVGIEDYWDQRPKNPMSIKGMLEQTEAKMILPPSKKSSE